MKSVMDRWVSSQGRLSQQGYLLAFVLPFVAVAGVTWLMFFGASGLLGAAGAYVLAFGWLFLMAMGDALNIRRYHDIGNSGRLYRLCRPGIVGLPVLAFVLHFLIPAQMASMGDMGALMHVIGQQFAPSMHPVPMGLLALTLAGVVLNVAYLSLMPGQAGANEHGPPPGGASVPVAPQAAATVSIAAAPDDDPVARALADYQKRQAQSARLTAIGAPASAASFGKRRR